MNNKDEGRYVKDYSHGWDSKRERGSGEEKSQRKGPRQALGNSVSADVVRKLLAIVLVLLLLFAIGVAVSTMLNRMPEAQEVEMETEPSATDQIDEAGQAARQAIERQLQSLEKDIRRIDEEKHKAEHPTIKEVTTPERPPVAVPEVEVPEVEVPVVVPEVKVAPAKSESKVKTEAPQRELSTLERMEEQSHREWVARARKAGVSTEGSTLDIIDRIDHKEWVERARKAGVSTEGSTLDIIDRIDYKEWVARARKAGVSAEGSTLDIIERINSKGL